MTPAEYLAALRQAGAPKDAGLLALDRYAASLFEIDKRTARKYRSGQLAVPQPIAVALRALATALRHRACVAGSGGG